MHNGIKADKISPSIEADESIGMLSCVCYAFMYNYTEKVQQVGLGQVPYYQGKAGQPYKT